jgi:transposase InsO family protein
MRAAVIDWFTRFVLSWRIANTLSTDFCLEVVEEAFSKYGKPQVFNTDQGSQYVYIFVPESGHQLHDGLKKYFEFYNFKRKHQNINDQVPNCVQLTTVMIITQLGSIEKVGQH